MSPVVPPLLARILHYGPGDLVNTPYGQGSVISSSDDGSPIPVKLSFGILYARREILSPDLTMLQYGEIPRGTKVIAPFKSVNDGASLDVEHYPFGIVKAFLVREKKYKIEFTSSDPTQVSEPMVELLSSEEIRLAIGTRVRTLFSLGTIALYRKESNSYVVDLDFGGIGYIMPKDITAIDMRLLSKVPKPVSAEKIYEKFQGRISQEEAQALYLMAQNSYRSIEKFFEEHAQAISLITTNALYTPEYIDALESLIDPSLLAATKRVKEIGKKEMDKLKAIAISTRKRVEEQLFDQGQDQKIAQEFFNRFATSIYEQVNDENHYPFSSSSPSLLQLTQVIQLLEVEATKKKLTLDHLNHALSSMKNKNIINETNNFLQVKETFQRLEQKLNGMNTDRSSSILMAMDPNKFLSQVEVVLPQMTEKANVWIEKSEFFLQKVQETPKGKEILTKTKKLLVQTMEKKSTTKKEFCDKMKNVVQLDQLAAWSSEMTTNKQKRQVFIDKIKDHSLDFFMSVLPTIQVETITGIHDRIEYAISKLDLSNFKVKKEQVKVRMGTVADEEIFTVRASNISALLKSFEWTFSQKYFPYLNGGGFADADLNGGTIALGFKAEKKKDPIGQYKPTLALNSIEIEIREELKISVQGSWFSAIYNVLATLFANLIKDYIAKTMESKVIKQMVKFIRTLNVQMGQYWPIILSLLEITVDDLPTASPWRGAKEIDIQPNQMECTFYEKDIPIVFTKSVLNRHCIVTRLLEPGASNQHQSLLPSTTTIDEKGGQEEKPSPATTTAAAAASTTQPTSLLPDSASSTTMNQSSNPDAFGIVSSKLYQIPVGASLVAVNGLACSKITLDETKELFDILPRPLTLRFSTSMEDARLSSHSGTQRVLSSPEYISVTFHEKSFGLKLRSRPLAKFGAIVIGFIDASDGKKGPAELSGKIQLGNILLRVNGIDLRFLQLPEILGIIKEAKRPATLVLAASPDGIVRLKNWPPMIELENSDIEQDGSSFAVISSFVRVPSYAQKCRLVDRGDVLVSINGMSMLSPEHKNFESIMETLRNVVAEGKPLDAVFVSREEFNTVFPFAGNGSTSGTTANVPIGSNSRTASRTSSQTNSGTLSPKSEVAALSSLSLLDAISRFHTKKTVHFPSPPLGILFGNLKDKAAFVRQFISSMGPAEKTGIISIGQAVLQVCGKNIGDATPSEVEKMIENVTEGPPYTLTLRDLEIERQLMKQ